MQSTSQKQKVHEEVRQISKFIGLLTSRLFLLVCLLLLFYAFRPTSIYLFVFGVILPPFLAILLSQKPSAAKPAYLLESCARKYNYSPERFRGELYTGYIFVIGLLLWQLRLNASTAFAFPLSIAPGAILLGYLLCRMISTKILRHKIKTYYSDLKIFD